MRSILLLPLVARYIDVIFMSVVVNVWGDICCVAAVVKNSVL